MTPEMLQKTRSLLIKHEDDRKRAYLDIYGNITVGIGHNLSARDISDDILQRWFKEDVLEFYNNWCSTFPWYLNLNEARQIALIDFSFMGWKKVLEFKKMLSYLEIGDMTNAAKELLNSEYGIECKSRATDIGNILIQGAF